MIYEIYELNHCKFYVREESGRLYIKDKKDGESKPIKFGIYSGEYDLLTLKDLMNITNKSLVDVAKIIESCNAILLRDAFDIYFFDYESVEKFLSTIGATKVLYKVI